MDPMLTVIVTRAIERLLVVAVGAFAIYIGFRLFVLMPSRKEGETKLDLPGGVSIFLSRVGPGIFFALFGAGLVAYSTTKPISFKVPAEIRVAASGSGQASEYVGMMPRSRSTSSARRSFAKTARVSRPLVVGTLNAIEAKVRPDLNTSERLDVEIAIREAKLALMREIWDDKTWGDYAGFQRWITDQAETGPPPEGSTEAAAFYRRGKK